MEEKLISIIIPVYKVEKYLDKCVESVVNQTYKNLEIILVDDGSPDGCPAMCDEWAKKDKRIKVIHKENGGVSLARNAGIDIASGDYLAFIDSDDYIDVTMYEKLIKSAGENNSDITFCRYVETDGDGNLKRVNEINLPKCNSSNIASFFTNKNAWIEGEVCYTDAIFGNTWRLLYKKSFVGESRFQSLTFAEDFLFNLNLFKKKPKISIVDEYLYYYYQREGSVVHTFNERKYNSKLEVIKQAVELLKDLVDDDTLCAYKFNSYYLLVTDFALHTNKNLFKEFKKKKWIQEYNCRKNYKCAQKKTKKFSTKFAHWLIYKRLFGLFSFLFRIKTKGKN